VQGWQAAECEYRRSPVQRAHVALIHEVVGDFVASSVNYVNALAGSFDEHNLTGQVLTKFQSVLASAGYRQSQHHVLTGGMWAELREVLLPILKGAWETAMFQVSRFLGDQPLRILVDGSSAGEVGVTVLPTTVGGALNQMKTLIEKVERQVHNDRVAPEKDGPTLTCFTAAEFVEAFKTSETGAPNQRSQLPPGVLFFRGVDGESWVPEDCKSEDTRAVFSVVFPGADADELAGEMITGSDLAYLAVKTTRRMLSQPDSRPSVRAICDRLRAVLDAIGVSYGGGGHETVPSSPDQPAVGNPNRGRGIFHVTSPAERKAREASGASLPDAVWYAEHIAAGPALVGGRLEPGHVCDREAREEVLVGLSDWHSSKRAAWGSMFSRTAVITLVDLERSTMQTMRLGSASSDQPIVTRVTKSPTGDPVQAMVRQLVQRYPGRIGMECEDPFVSSSGPKTAREYIFFGPEGLQNQDALALDHIWRTPVGTASRKDMTPEVRQGWSKDSGIDSALRAVPNLSASPGLCLGWPMWSVERGF
jgi:hypothetical protein